jgi:hypothetical protein
MTVIELRKLVEDYEQYKNIYMNFSVDEKGIWGLPEGDHSQHLLSMERITEYKEFLNNAIEHYENMKRFFNDYECTKKNKKYKTYLKRLENAMKKVA